MTIRKLWVTYNGWKLSSEVCVYKGTTLIYEGSYLWMPEDVKDAPVYQFDVKDSGLVIFIKEI